jgi:hypothetical protein
VQHLINLIFSIEETMSGITYILLGLMTFVLIHYKPTAYWNNNNNCSFLRQHIGDRATAILHELVGFGLIAMGMIILFNLEHQA